MFSRFIHKLPIYNFAFIVGTQSLLMGLYLMAYPEKFDLEAYKPLFSIADKTVFGVLLIAIGATILYGYSKMNFRLCRIGLMAFGIYCSMEAGGYIASFVNGNSGVTLWPIIKDFAMMGLCGVGAFSTFPYSNLEGK